MSRITEVQGQNFDLTDNEIIEMARKTHPKSIPYLAVYLEFLFDGDRPMDFSLDDWRCEFDKENQDNFYLQENKQFFKWIARKLRGFK